MSAAGAPSILVLLLFSAAASAQTIYKCKGPDGRYTYSNQACAGDGTALGKSGVPMQGKATTAPEAKPPAETESTEQTPTTRAALPKQCDNAAMLKTVVARLDSPATPNDVRAFLAEERLRLLRCEYMRFTPEELRSRDMLMVDIGTADPARRRAAMLRVQALYDRYMTAADRAARSANRQR